MNSVESSDIGARSEAARKFVKANLTPAFLIAFVAFEALYVADMIVTSIGAAGDHTAEANTLARLWWEVMGPLQFIEVPIWSSLVFVTALIIHARSKLLAVIWLVFLACQHLFGLLTWLPYGTLNFLYLLPDWASGYGISIMSAVIALPLSMIIVRFLGRSHRV